MKNFVLPALAVALLGCGDEDPPTSTTTGASIVTCPTAGAAEAVLPPGLGTVSPAPVGTIAGTFQISSTGSAVYAVPLVAPPGINKLTPELGVAYDSSSKEGLLGAGFGLRGLTAITRCPLTYARDQTIRDVTYDDKDALCLDGARLVAIGTTPMGEREYRTVPDQLIRVIGHMGSGSQPDWFEAFDRDGTVRQLGKSNDSKLKIKDGTIAQWWVNERHDRYENWIRYNYKNSVYEGERWQFYPDTIEYAGHGPNPAKRKIAFDYLSWSAHPSIYLGGRELVQNRRISAVRMLVTGAPDALVRKYNFVYGTNPATGRAQLTSLEECSPTAVCKPVTKLGWISNPVGGIDSTSTIMTGSATRGLVADVNGDGLDDVVISTGASLPPTTKVLLNQGSGQFAPPVVWHPNHAMTGGLPIDYNHDGRMDFLVADDPDDTMFSVFVAQPAGGFTKLVTDIGNYTFTTMCVPTPDHSVACASTTWVTKRIHAADFNGDGLMDIATCTEQTAPDWEQDRWAIRWGAPNGFAGTSASPELADHSCADDIKFVDVDSDGKVDIIAPASPFGIGCVDCMYDVYEFAPSARPAVDSGGLWNVQGDWTRTSTDLKVDSIFDKTMMFLDLNGDGNIDVVQKQGTGLATRLNTGIGFAPAVTATTGPDNYNAHLDKAKVIDWDADGNMDLLVPVQCGAFEACWTVLVASHDGTGHFTATTLPIQDHGDLWVTSVAGVSKASLLVIHDDKIVIHNHGGRNGLLTSITDGMNAFLSGTPGFTPNVSINYDSLVDLGRMKNLASGSAAEDAARYVAHWAYAGNPDAYPRGAITGPATVVGAFGVNDGLNGTHWRDVRYRDGRYDALAGGGLGFGAKIVYDQATASTTVERYDNVWKLDEVYPALGVPSVRLEWHPPLSTQDDADELVMGKRTTQFTIVASAPHTFLALPSATDEWKYEGTWNPAGSGPLAHVTQQMTVGNETGHTRGQVLTYDTYGNATSEIQETVGVEKTTYTRQFANDPTTWLIGRPTHVTTTSQAGGESQTVEEGTTYTTEGSPRLVTRTVPGDASAQHTTSSSYDLYGNVTGTTEAGFGAADRSACTTYDHDGIYAIAAKNALGHLTYARHDPGTGVAIATRDPNGLDTRYQIDAFGRPTKIAYPDGTQTNIDRTLATNGGPSANWRVQRIRTYRTGGDDETVELDMLGREIRTDSLGPDVQACEDALCMAAPRYATTTEFDKLGNAWRRSRPFLTTATTAQKTFETTDFDALGRPWKINTPWDQTIRYAYDRRTQIVKTSAGDQTTERDAAGRTISVRDRNGGVTTYTYGPFGHNSTIDALGAVSKLSIDPVGRTRRIDDPDHGTTVMTYDGFGDPRERTDALGQTVTYQHDLLGRRVQRTDPQTTATWTYDPANCVGCLAGTSTSQGVSRSLKYDPKARPIESTLTVDGVPYTMSVVYDPSSRPGTVSYPSVGAVVGPKVKLVYSTNGRIRRVTNDANTLTYFDATRYDGIGNVTRSTLGSGISIERTYDHKSGALDRLKSSAGAVLLQDLAYTQDERLNTILREDLKANQKEHFDYDALDRLWCQKWNPETSACITQIAYADNGNITSKSDVGAYTYAAAHPHAALTAGSSVFKYDAAGNQTGRPGVGIEYTAFDLPSKYVLGSGDVDFLYDAELARVRKHSATETKTYFGDAYERVQAGGTDQHRYYVDVGEARLVITKQALLPETQHYTLPDGMGSMEIIATPTGSVIERRSYDAWGARRPLTWASAPAASYPWSITKSSFTGQEQDDEVGLVNMKGRIYDPVLARFIQADPLTQSPFFTQSWNRYAYGYNNPLRYTDPTGFSSVSNTDGSSGTSDGATDVTGTGVPATSEPNQTTPKVVVVNSPVPGDDAQPLPQLPPPATSDYQFASDPGETTSPFAKDEATEIAESIAAPDSNAGASGLADVATGGAALLAGAVGSTSAAPLLANPWVLGGAALAAAGFLIYSMTTSDDSAKAGDGPGVGAGIGAGIVADVLRRFLRRSPQGSIYIVPAPYTRGKVFPYVGRTNTPYPRLFRRSDDGRDRKQSNVVELYDAFDVEQGRILEQTYINSHGGLRCLDNDRNEIAPELWPLYGIAPPGPDCLTIIP